MICFEFPHIYIFQYSVHPRKRGSLILITIKETVTKFQYFQIFNFDYCFFPIQSQPLIEKYNKYPKI